MCRKRFGLNQSELAEILGFRHEGRIGKWEKGITLPSSINTIKLSALFDATLEDLFPEAYGKLQDEMFSKYREIRKKQGLPEIDDLMA